MPLMISLMTLVNHDDTIINSTNFPLPEGLNHTSLDPLLLAETAELEILYPEPDTLKMVIKAWATVRGPAWTKMLAALTAEYDPISNYDRTEYWTDTHNLTNSKELHETNSREFHGTNTGSINGNGATVSSGSGTDTTTVAGFNSTEWANKDKVTRSDSANIQTSNTQSSTGANDYADTLTKSAADTNRDTGTLTRAGSVSGNIGVMTNQKMIQEELELRQTDMYRIIVKEFIKMFCLGVY